MRTILILLAALLAFALPAAAQQATAILTENRALIEKPSRQTIGPVIDALAASGDPTAATILQAWADRTLGIRKSDGLFFILSPNATGWDLRDLTGAPAGAAAKSDILDLKPNAGVRGLIATALVQFTLSDPDPAKRADALTSIARDPNAAALAPLRASIDTEPDPALKAQKSRLERLLTMQFDPDSAAASAAIDSFGADLGLDLRAALNPLLATQRLAVAGDFPDGTNIARRLNPGTDLTEAEAYDILVAASLAPARLTVADARAALQANIVDGTVGGIAVASLDDQTNRDRAYEALEAAGTVPPAATDAEAAAALQAHTIAEVYSEPDTDVTAAAPRRPGPDQPDAGRDGGRRPDA